MTMAMTQEQIFTRVKEALVEALGVDDDEVTAQATLIGDLGAESIDFLDIVFRLEKAFNIKIPHGQLFPDDMPNNAEFFNGKKLTAPGLAELHKRMPHVDLSEFEKDPQVDRITELFTVDAIVRYLGDKGA